VIYFAAVDSWNSRNH